MPFHGFNQQSLLVFIFSIFASIIYAKIAMVSCISFVLYFFTHGADVVLTYVAPLQCPSHWCKVM